MFFLNVSLRDIVVWIGGSLGQDLSFFHKKPFLSWLIAIAMADKNQNLERRGGRQ